MTLHQPRRPRLLVEALEDRCVLSANPYADQLLITSTAGQVTAVKVADGLSVEDAIAAYGKDASVASVEVAQEVSVAVIPNDAGFGNQYDMRNIGQGTGTSDADIDSNQAWDISTGSYLTAVGVIDTGIMYTHPDLYKNIWINQGEIPDLGVVDTDSDGIITFADLNASANSSLVSDLNGTGYIDAGDLLADSDWADGSDTDGDGHVDDLIGWDFVNDDNNPLDDHGHGTHVAGTIGAVGNNGIGVAGVNWTVSIAALKFLGSTGSGSTAGALAALEYANDHGIQITNNSWGGGGYSSAMNTAINNANTLGYIFVAAAGNSSANNNTIANYPSNYSADNVVAVASTDAKDALSSFSNYGSLTVDLAAPGSSIYSTMLTSGPLSNSTGYGYLSGTSMAAPHVAGALALVWSTDTTQTYDQVISRVLNNVDTLSGLSSKVVTGGRLNVYKAVSAAASAATQPRVVSSLADSTSSPSSVLITFNKEIDPTTFTLDDITNFTGPNGAITLTPETASVTGVDSSGSPISGSTKFFKVSFAAQTAAGSYRFDVGPDVRDSAGSQMNQDGDSTAGEAGDAYHVTFSVSSSPSTFTSTAQAAIRDFATASTRISVGQGMTISDVNVKVNIKHTYDSDLQIYLVGPDGTRVNLSNNRGGSGDNYTNTVFDDQALTAISAGSAPFAGTYRPDALLSAFNGKEASGAWTLYAYDGGRKDTGTLLGWSLIVTGSPSAAGVVLDAEGVAEPAAPVAAATPAAGAAAFVWPSLSFGTIMASAPVAAVQEQRPAEREAVPFSAEVAIARREAVDSVFAAMRGGERPRRGAAWGEDAFGWASE